MINIQSMAGELWLPVANTNDRYYISNLGRLATTNWKMTGRTQIMKPAPNKKGYLKTCIIVSGKIKPVSLHRLVAHAFIPNPENKPQVNHKNFITSDNRLENLEWCTGLENNNHKKEAGRFKWNGFIPPVKRGSSNGFAKLNEQQVAEIRMKFKPRVYTRQMLAEEYGVSHHTIKDAILRRWKHVPMK